MESSGQGEDGADGNLLSPVMLDDICDFDDDEFMQLVESLDFSAIETEGPAEETPEGTSMEAFNTEADKMLPPSDESMDVFGNVLDKLIENAIVGFPLETYITDDGSSYDCNICPMQGKSMDACGTGMEKSEEITAGPFTDKHIICTGISDNSIFPLQEGSMNMCGNDVSQAKEETMAGTSMNISNIHGEITHENTIFMPQVESMEISGNVLKTTKEEVVACLSQVIDKISDGDNHNSRMMIVSPSVDSGSVIDVVMKENALKKIGNCLPFRDSLNDTEVSQLQCTEAKEDASLWEDVQLEEWKRTDNLLNRCVSTDLDTRQMVLPSFYWQQPYFWRNFCHFFACMWRLESITMRCRPADAVATEETRPVKLICLRATNATSPNSNLPVFIMTDVKDLKISAYKNRSVLTCVGDISDMDNFLRLSQPSFVTKLEVDVRALAILAQLEELEVSELAYQQPEIARLAIEPLQNLSCLHLNKLIAFNQKTLAYMHVACTLPYLKELQLGCLAVNESFVDVISSFNRLLTLSISLQRTRMARSIDRILRGVLTLDGSLQFFTLSLRLGARRRSARVILPLPARGDDANSAAVRRYGLLSLPKLQREIQQRMPSAIVTVNKLAAEMPCISSTL